MPSSLPNQTASPQQSFTVLPDAELDATLTDAQMTELLYQLSLQGENAADFVVLPEGYAEPAAGLDGVFSLLLIGVDTDGQGVTGRSDTMVLAVINTRKRSIRLVSFLRDLYVKIPGHGHNRLNAAYVYGGPELLMQTLSQTFGVYPDAYLAVDFGLMGRLVDAIGGVEMTVSEQEVGALNGILEYYNYQHGVPEVQGRLDAGGVVRLTGLQAMSYARIRKLDSDFGRAQRQQRTLAAIVAQLGTLDVRELLELVVRFAGEVKTDVTAAQALALVAEALPLTGYTLDALSVPVEGAGKNVLRGGAFYLLPNVKKNVSAINAFLGISGD